MYLTDYHFHTLCSPDASYPLTQMVGAAIEAGMDELCVTDHCDLLEIDGVSAATFHWEPIEEQVALARSQFAGKLPIRMGLELGEAWVDPDLSRRIVSHPQVDFVIGSVHTLDEALGGTDLAILSYRSEEVCYTMLDNYFQSMEKLVALDCFDILGHVVYPLRYTNFRDGCHATLDRYLPQIERIFRSILSSGRGIEINTNRGNQLEDWNQVLPLYRDCGGQFITLGSDAHVPQHVGRGIAQAARMAKEYGLRLAVYEKHQPRFISL